MKKLLRGYNQILEWQFQNQEVTLIARVQGLRDVMTDGIIKAGIRRHDLG